MAKSKFSVVIPTFKPGNEFREILQKISVQTFLPNRVIIINTEKKYLQESLYAGICNVEVYHIKTDEFDHGATRDKGLSMVEDEFVIFMTQDAIPNNEFLFEELLKPFSDSLVGVVYARQIGDKGCNIIENYTREFNYPNCDIVKSKNSLEELGIKTYFSSDVCAAYRKEFYINNGGFEKNTIFNEDSIYAAKIINDGKKVVYASKAIVVHYHNYKLMQYLRRNFDLGVSHSQYEKVFSGLKSENEGVILVKKTIKFLIKEGKIYLIPSLIFKSGFKYVGYKLGKNYVKLPYFIIKKLSMNKGYWAKKGV